MGGEEPLKGWLSTVPSLQRGLERRDLHQHQLTTGAHSHPRVWCLVGRAEQWSPSNFQPTFSTEFKTLPCISPPCSASENCLLFPKILRGRRGAGFPFSPRLPVVNAVSAGAGPACWEHAYQLRPHRGDRQLAPRPQLAFRQELIAHPTPAIFRQA